MDRPNGLSPEDAHGGAEHCKRARLSQSYEGDGYRIDVAEAVEKHPHAKKLLADEATTPGLRRTIVKTTIVMKFPVQG